MPSTYTVSLRAELQGTGENSGTWGTKLNTLVNEVLEPAITGVANVSMSDANYTLSTANGTTDEARNAVIQLTGTLTVSRNVVCPTARKLYVVYNNTTGGQSIVFKTSAGSGVTVANGTKRLVYCDGTNVVDMLTALPSGTTIGGGTAYVSGGTDVSLADGGTGASLADPNADRIFFWDDSAGATTWLAISTGLLISGTNLALAHLGIESLVDPNADRILFWDDSAGASAWLSMPAAGIAISGTAITLTNDLAALEGLAGTGFASRSGTDTWVQRTLAAGTGIAVTNGDGVSGNPSIALSHLGLQSLVDPNADRIFFWDDSAGASAWLAPDGFGIAIDTTTLYATETWMVAASDETTTITTGTNKVTFVFPYNVTVLSVGASLNTVSSSGTPTIDINESGTSILSTKITIDVSEKTSLTAAVAPVISDSSITAGNEIGVDVDTAGTGAKGLKVWMIVRRTS